MMDILIVEDNKEIGTLLCDFLRKENYTVSVAHTGEKALELYEKYGAKVIVLDIMLPGMNGFAVCSKIRETSNTHILIASAKVEKNDKLKGLNLGADDYIEKPYDIDILIAKIKGIFKRKYGQAEIVEGNIKLNTVQQTVYVDGQKKEVTEKEFELLKLLIENKNVTMKKEYLFNNVWGSDSDSEMQTLTVHIKWLREKIEEDPKSFIAVASLIESTYARIVENKKLYTSLIDEQNSRNQEFRFLEDLYNSIDNEESKHKVACMYDITARGEEQNDKEVHLPLMISSIRNILKLDDSDNDLLKVLAHIIDAMEIVLQKEVDNKPYELYFMQTYFPYLHRYDRLSKYDVDPDDETRIEISRVSKEYINNLYVEEDKKKKRD